MSSSAETSKQRAANAIDAKYKVLEAWAAKGIPYCSNDDGTLLRNADGDVVLEFAPTNLKAFCEWNASRNTSATRELYPDIESTTRSTLYLTHADKASKLSDLFKVLRARIKLQSRQANKTGQITDLEHEVRYLRALASKQGDDLIAAAINSTDVENELLRVQRALASTRNHYEVENQQLKARNAELAATLQKLSPLRKKDLPDA